MTLCLPRLTEGGEGSPIGKTSLRLYLVVSVQSAGVSNIHKAKNVMYSSWFRTKDARAKCVLSIGDSVYLRPGNEARGLLHHARNGRSSACDVYAITFTYLRSSVLLLRSSSQFTRTLLNSSSERTSLSTRGSKNTCVCGGEGGRGVRGGGV